jgi:hypothetical protein
MLVGYLVLKFFVLVGSYIGGTVLSGTKYGLKQTRGKFGLGAKMVSILLCVYLWGVIMNSHCHS